MIPDSQRPWYPVTLKGRLKAIYAIQALAKGEADAEQQKRALDFIIDHIGWRERLSYFPDNPRDTDFGEGRRFVSEQLVKILKLTGQDLEKLK